MLLAFIWIAIAAYLLGSIPVGYVLVRLFRRQDIRTLGSGNIGATNVLRSEGKGLGAATFTLDVFKGAAAVLWALPSPLLASHRSPAQRRSARRSLRGPRAHVPHLAQVSRRQRVATGFGVFLVAAPWAALSSITLFFIVFDHPLRFSRLHPRRGQLSRIRLFHGSRRAAGLLHRRAGHRRAAHHRQASPQHPPPARRQREPFRAANTA